MKEKFKLINRLKSYSIDKTEDTLHLLTDKGLETYGLNLMPIFLNYRKYLSIFELNFRRFLNIECLLSTKNYLILLSEMQNNLRTIYSLRKPSIRDICCDINSIISDSNLKSDEKYIIMSYLNSILHFNCKLNLETDFELNILNQKSCIDLCNFLKDIKTSKRKKFALNLINSAKLEFSHLINYNLKYELIIEFIRSQLLLEKSFNVFDCELSLVKKNLEFLLRI